MSGGSIIFEPITKRKQGANILGNGCTLCKYRLSCSLKKCSMLKRVSYEGSSQLASDYLCFKIHLKQETYIREYRNKYIIITKGEQFTSGEIDPRWHIHFYFKGSEQDRKSWSTCVPVPDENIFYKKGKAYIYIRGFGQMYGVKDKIPLKDSSAIMLY